jgi:hypothetical protein
MRGDPGMNQPPVQQAPCPSCGQPIPTPSSYCAHCGSRGPATTKRASRAVDVWIVLFILIGVPSFCLGGCFLLIDPAMDTTALFGLIAIAIGAFLLGMLIRAKRKAG